MEKSLNLIVLCQIKNTVLKIIQNWEWGSFYENMPIRLYPNPAKNIFNIRLIEPALNPRYIRIINLSGTVLVTIEIDPLIRDYQIPINLKNGIYFYELNKGDNITYRSLARQSGVAACRNAGIRSAQGKYIAYLDDDDIYYPDHLRTLVEFLEQGEYKAAYTDTAQAIQAYERGRYRTAGIQNLTLPDFDSDTILVLNGAAFVPFWRYDPATLLSWAMTADHAVLAEVDGRPAGFAITTNSSSADCAQLIRVATHPAFQGRGIGRQMVADAMCCVYGNDRDGLALNTQASNRVARHLYETLGFRQNGQAVKVMTYRCA